MTMLVGAAAALPDLRAIGGRRRRERERSSLLLAALNVGVETGGIEPRVVLDGLLPLLPERDLASLPDDQRKQVRKLMNLAAVGRERGNDKVDRAGGQESASGPSRDTWGPISISTTVTSWSILPFQRDAQRLAADTGAAQEAKLKYRAQKATGSPAEAAEASARLGALLWLERDPEGVSELRESARKGSTDISIQAAFLLARALTLDESERAEGIGWYRRVIESRHETYAPEAQVELARLVLDQGDVDAARGLLEDMMAPEGEGNPYACFHLARILLRFYPKEGTRADDLLWTAAESGRPIADAALKELAQHLTMSADSGQLREVLQILWGSTTPPSRKHERPQRGSKAGPH